MKKVLLIILIFTLFFQLKVHADVDGIPDGTYLGKAYIFAKARGDRKIIRKKFKSPLALVVANKHITGFLLIKAKFNTEPGVVSAPDQSISIHKTDALTRFTTGTTKFTYDQASKTIKFNTISHFKLPDAQIGQVATLTIYKSVGQAKALKKHTSEEIASLESYSENINNDCKSTHFVNIGSDGYVIAQPFGQSNGPTFFGRITNQEGDFTTIYSEAFSFKENRILSITSNPEKIIVKGVSIEFDSSANTAKDTPFETEFLKTGCN